MLFTGVKTTTWIISTLIIAAAGPVLGDQSPVFADSTAVEEMVVSGQASARTKGSESQVRAPQITVHNPGSLADLGAVLPSVRVATNSRGESTLMVRGAPERHVQTYLDGIPLNLPWDERVDLETIPITGVGRLVGRRGLPTLLDGPGALAGTVRILPPVLAGKDRSARMNLSLGSEAQVRANLTGQRRQGPWNLLAAGGWQSRDAFPLPEGGEPRFNSDLEQLSVLLRGSRPVAGQGRLNLLASLWGGNKGVPPELHLGDEARFWRYPVRSRALLGGSLALPLGAWDLNAMTALDFYRQEIDARGPDGWDQPLVNGQDYEKDFDRTGHLAAGATRWLDHFGRVSLQTNLRYTQHRESLTVGGGVNSYSQVLGGVVVEGEFFAGSGWVLRTGGGMDFASTPEAGDKEQADGFTAPALNLRLSHPLGPRAEFHAGASRRSRFPSLRELYSGALGRFVPNPDLVPEQQDLFEAGINLEGTSWQLTGAAFLQYLTDGIERISLSGPERQFKRVNLTSIRVPGLEFHGNWSPGPDWNVFGQHTILAARVETEDGFDRPAEDRPDYLSRLGVQWRQAEGPAATVEVAVTGARWSADATNEATGLTRLPAHARWNGRLSWVWDVGQRADKLPVDLETFLRVENLFDQRADYQVGLPESGRIFSVGASLGY